MSLSLSNPAMNEKPRMGSLLEKAGGPRRCGECSFPKTRNAECVCVLTGVGIVQGEGEVDEKRGLGSEHK